ncbi:hypothetical protein [Gluconobacter cerinus]|uniref:hypothetical protein n=1 Tax=Gluconobacter cerinus TaxID=38307 RepID=UPI001B8C1451|nr:hypothetical protein [Gluconobacter cerinus]MBS0994716.1 hypothetical protein [Gluconobacter cerinus]
MKRNSIFMIALVTSLSGCSSSDRELMPEYTQANGNYEEIAECLNYNAQNDLSQDPGVITIASMHSPPQARVAEEMRGAASMLVWSAIFIPLPDNKTVIEFRALNSLFGGAAGWWNRVQPTLKKCAPTIQPLRKQKF